MYRRLVARAWGASRQSWYRPLGIIVAAAATAGCASQPSNGAFPIASSPVPFGATVAFESVDGPPPEVFRKLVADLNDEAAARKIAVVSRTGPAVYRVRGYVSAIVERDKTTFAWVWDVYDTDKRRAVRIAGEEPAAGTKRRGKGAAAAAWTAADDKVLRQMAKNGMEQMAAFLNSPTEPIPPAAAPEQPTIAMASARDDSPEAAGIFRVFAAEAPTATTPAAADPVASDNADTPAQPAQASTKPSGKPRKAHTAAVAPATDGVSQQR